MNDFQFLHCLTLRKIYLMTAIITLMFILLMIGTVNR